MTMKIKKSILTDTELKASLSSFGRSTRVAILLMFVLKASPDEVSSLTWSRVRISQQYKLALRLLNKTPRHLFSDLIFWNSESVMNNLKADVDLFLGEITLDEYRKLYANMLYVDESSKAFIRLMNKAVLEMG